MVLVLFYTVTVWHGHGYRTGTSTSTTLGGRFGVSTALGEDGVGVYRCAGVRAQVARTLVWPDTHALASPCTHTCKHTKAKTYKRTNIPTHKHTRVHALHARTHAHTHAHAQTHCTHAQPARKRQWVLPTQAAIAPAGSRTAPREASPAATQYPAKYNNKNDKNDKNNPNPAAKQPAVPSRVVLIIEIGTTIQ